MFSPPKLSAIATRWLSAIVVLILLQPALTSAVYGQSGDADYNRRLAAMQQARDRAGAPSTYNSAPSQMRVANADYEYAAPPAPSTQQRVAQATANVPRGTSPTTRQATSRQQIAAQPPMQQSHQRVAAAPQQLSQQRYAQNPNQQPVRTARANSPYAPAHTRTAQLHDGAIVTGGGPVIDTGSYDAVVGGGVIDSGYYEGGFEGGCADGSCSSCGDAGGYFDCGDGCCGRGGCPDGPCWLSGLGAILYNGDYFAGAVGFQNGPFANPATNNSLVGDSNFGFYGGFNYGIPLCRLTCGLLSGQFGVRSVQTNFNGNQFSQENRDQTFITAGLYRRVDYGLQGGVVADVVYEDWFTQTQTVQLRTDIGWVWQGGTIFGYRYAANVQDDVQPATINGNIIPDLITGTRDWHRFYLRHEASAGGYGEMFFGWSEAEQTIFGMEADLPITDRLSAQSTFTYFLDNTPVPAGSGFEGGHLGDAWNIAVGFAWRPQGRGYYRQYDRPLFGVADNGTMLLTRE